MLMFLSTHLTDQKGTRKLGCWGITGYTLRVLGIHAMSRRSSGIWYHVESVCNVGYRIQNSVAIPRVSHAAILISSRPVQN
mmetsp:Transcript_31195/g.46324  ORF Transcript_31195/g.46324 Transcript_31195/m.46324 type:complete len:81 (-) Transcript_31195:150-392(-)